MTSEAARHAVEGWNLFGRELAMEACIFCKIIRKEAPSYTVYEDENSIAFLDIRPMNPGHTLIVSKKHYRWVWDITDVGKYFETVTMIARTLQKTMRTDWIAADVAGMGVPHAHIHLVPRYPGDGHGEFVNGKNVKTIPTQEMSRITETIRNSLMASGVRA